MSEVNDDVTQRWKMWKMNEHIAPYSLMIVRVDDGYTIQGEEFDRVAEDSETDELRSHEKLLWDVMEYFNFGGTKHDKERLRIVREKGEDYAD